MWKCDRCGYEMNRVSFQALNKDLSYQEEFVKFECQNINCRESSTEIEEIATWED